jgi:glutamate 5-kinase
MSSELKNTQNIVIKLGTSTLTCGGHPNLDLIATFCEELKQLRERGINPVVVTSGAVELGIAARPLDCGTSVTRAGFAAVGQVRLMTAFAECFATHGYWPAQLLLKREDLFCERTRTRLTSAIASLSCSNAIVLINENDVTSTGGGFPSNDELSAAIARLLNAGTLLIFTDRPGVYEADPRLHPQARMFRTIGAWNNRLLAAASDIPGAAGKGGMKSKVHAARAAAEHGGVTVITRYVSRALQRITDGERIGTWIIPDTAADPSPSIITAELEEEYRS